MYQKLYSCCINGLDSHILEIEVDVANGMPFFNIIGVNDTTARGIRERIRSAISSSGFTLSPHKITVNAASLPSAMPREGLDLPIALGILCAERLLPSHHCDDHAVVGNLTLNGELRPVHGILNMTALCRDQGYSAIIVPASNAQEASMIHGIRVLPVHTLAEAADYWRGQHTLSPAPTHPPKYQTPSTSSIQYIRGQLPGKRVLEIAAAGFHNLLFCGPPGCGKTLLLQSLASLLPPPDDSEVPDLLRIRSISSEADSSSFSRPVCQPHHSLTTHALIGGGHPIRPGEMTRAHGGILLMDEIAEFSRSVLENLRQPLESHQIQLHYLNEIRIFPADFLLAAAMNLCPCGHYPNMERCTCHPHAVRRYQTRLGTPLIERFDLCLILDPVPDTDNATLSSLDINCMKDRIAYAYEQQHFRFRNESFFHNSRMDAAAVDKYCILSSDASSLFRKASIQFSLSMRQQHNIKKSARSIADLADHSLIEVQDLMEALQYRPRGFLNMNRTTEEYKSVSYTDQPQTEASQTKGFAE